MKSTTFLNENVKFTHQKKIDFCFLIYYITNFLSKAYKLNSKLSLDDDQQKERFDWSKKNLQRFEKLNSDENFAVADVKYFQLPRTRKLRRGFFKQTVRWVYRKKNENCKPGSYKRGGMKTGNMSRSITFGLIYKNKIFVKSWVGTKKRRWNTTTCCATIKEVRRMIDDAFPSDSAKKIPLLLDGDPVMQTERSRKIISENGFEMIFGPARSPDLNCLDYWGWNAIAKGYRRRIKEKVGDNDDKDAEEFIIDKPEFLEMIESSAKSVKKNETKKSMSSLILRIKKTIFMKGGRFEGKSFTDEEKQIMDNY